MIKIVLTYYMKKYIIPISFLLANFSWFLYLEINPKLRNIWLRIDSNGTTRFAPHNVYNLIAYSFKNIEMWKVNNWDINYVTVVFFGTFVFKYLLNNLR